MKEIINTQDYQEIINTNKPVLLDFYADWCGPCQTLLPIIEKFATKNSSEFVVAKINVEKNRELAVEFSVRSIPALFILKDGEVKENFVGVQSEAFLQEKMNQYVEVPSN